MATARVLLVLTVFSLMLVAFRSVVVFVTRKDFLLVGGFRRRSRRKCVVVVSSVRKFRRLKVKIRVNRLKGSNGIRFRLKKGRVRLGRSWIRFVGRLVRKRRFRSILARFRLSLMSVRKNRKRIGLTRRFGRPRKKWCRW